MSRSCMDCNVDISHLYSNTRRCPLCQKKRRAKTRSEIRQEKQKTKPKRICACGVDITHKRINISRCDNCQIEYRKKLSRKVSRNHYAHTKGYKNQPGQDRFCVDCKANITARPANCERCENCQTKHRNKQSNKRYYNNEGYYKKYRKDHNQEFKKYHKEHYQKNQSRILEEKRRKWEEHIAQENIHRKELGMPLLTLGYANENKLKDYLDLLIDHPHYDNKFWVCEMGGLTNRGNALGGLQLDRYYPHLKTKKDGKTYSGIAFEYDGQQHFEHQQYFHKTKTEFLKYQERDRLTDKICEEANILLIRVSYKENLSKEFVEAIIQGVIV